MPLRDLNTVPWPQPANCVGLDPNIFFPVDNTHNNTDEAQLACRPCPAKQHCATQAITNNERYGVWAGINLRNNPHRIRQLHTIAGLPTPTTTPKMCGKGHQIAGDNLRTTTSGTGRIQHKCRTCENTARTTRKPSRSGTPPPPRTHCPQGHKYTPENTTHTAAGTRRCTTCTQQTHCKHGHPYTHTPAGKRVCKTCRNTNQARYRTKKAVA